MRKRGKHSDPMKAPDILLSFFGSASILDRFAHLYPKERQPTVLPFLFVGHRVRKPVQAASLLPVSPVDAVPRTRPLTASRGGSGHGRQKEQAEPTLPALFHIPLKMEAQRSSLPDAITAYEPAAPQEAGGTDRRGLRQRPSDIPRALSASCGTRRGQRPRWPRR